LKIEKPRTKSEGQKNVEFFLMQLEIKLKEIKRKC
jgi:hypothetical protein